MYNLFTLLLIATLLFFNSLELLGNGPKKHGDNLESFRKNVLKVYEKKLPLKAIELGVGGFALRGIDPILSKKVEYDGSVGNFYTPNDALKLIIAKNDKIGFCNVVSADLGERLFEPEVLQ